jgi:predicted Zn finger-like uncharacterized protein
MEVRCERCKTQYELDDSRVSETGVTVQCTTCHHVFVVKKKALVVTMAVKPGQLAPETPPVPLGGPPPTPPPAGLQPLGEPIRTAAPVGTASANPGNGNAEPAPVLPPAAVGPGERSREWRVRQASGNLFTLKDLTTLQKWIVERKVSRDDEISLTGDSWKRLGDIAELATFFQLVDEAQRAAVLQAQVNMGMGTPPAPATPRSPEPLAPQRAAPPPVAPAHTRESARRFPLFLVLLVLLLAGGASAFYYLQVYLPTEAEAARLALAQRQEQERLAQERLEQERAEKAAAEARALAEAQADAGREEASEDGGALAAGALEGTEDGGTGDAGALVDMDVEAGTPDAGALADVGAAPDAGGRGDAGAPTVKRPAPVRDFDYYMSQGDRNRDRERSEAALQAYAQAAELEPARAEPYAGRGMAFLDMGDTRQAETEFKQALKFNPRYGEAIIGLAETYRTQGKKAEAIRYYERYLEILPNGPEATVARSAIERLKE